MISRELPSYDVHEFATRAADYCVCVFVIDEGDRLLGQLERMKPYADKVDVVVADGGSTDGSTEPSKLLILGVNTLLVKTGAGRLGAQMRMAFDWALNRGYRGVIVVDGNGKDGVEAIPDFVAKLDSGHDHVQGSRFLKGGVSENLPLGRWLGVHLIHAPLISARSGFRYTDTTNGFRAYSATFLADPRVSVFRDVFVGYELHYYLAITAPRLGFRVTEIPVARRYPSSGKTPTKIDPLFGNLDVLKRLMLACLGSYDVCRSRK